MKKQPKESVSEYVRRVGERSDLNDQEIATVTTAVVRKIYSPKSSLSDDEAELLSRLTSTVGQSDTPSVRLRLSHFLEPPLPVTSTALHEWITDRSRSYEGLRYTPSWMTGRDFGALLALFVVGSYVLYTGLSAYPLRPWDEGMYANAGRHMVQDGYWLVPHFHHFLGAGLNSFGPYFEKPPLGMWFIGISMSVFGVTEFGSRFPSASFGLLTVGLIYLLTRRVSSPAGGVTAGAVYLSTPFFLRMFNGPRVAGLETMHIFFGTLFVTSVLAVSNDRSRKWEFALFGSAVAVVLVKGFAAGIFLLVVLPLVVVNWRTWVKPKMMVGSLISLSIMSLWPLYMYSRYGDSFVQIIFTEQVLSRVGGSLNTYPGALFPWMKYPYFRMLWSGYESMEPWVYFLVPVVTAVAVSSVVRGDDTSSILRRDEARFVGFNIWWAASIFTFFLFTGNHQWYVLPILVPVSVLLGIGASWASEGRKAPQVGILAGLGILLAYQPLSFEVLLLGLISLLVVLSGIGPLKEVVVRYVPEDRTRSSLKTAASILVAVVVVTQFVQIPIIVNEPDAIHDHRELGNYADSNVPEDATIYVDPGLGVALHSFAFYADRETVHRQPSELPVENGPLWAVVSPDILNSLPDSCSQEYGVENSRGDLTLVRCQ